eukprot:COSAG06_NODE_32167_length_510_cov_0.871046_1_plen_51_part_10
MVPQNKGGHKIKIKKAIQTWTPQAVASAPMRTKSFPAPAPAPAPLVDPLAY